jgi:predicted RNA-binding protein Jag
MNNTKVSNISISKNEQEVITCLENLIKLLGVESAKIEFIENEFHRKTFVVSTEIAEDRGRIIGKKGQNINALITILNAYSKQRGVQFATIHLKD